MMTSAMVPAASLDIPSGPAVRPAPASDWRIQAAIVFGFHFAYYLFYALRLDHALIFASSYDWAAYKLDQMVRNSVNVAAAVAALQFIGRRYARHRHRKLVAVFGMLIAGLTAAAIGTFIFPYEPMAVSVGATASTATYFWFTLWNNTMVNLLSLLAIDTLHRRQQAMNQLAYGAGARTRRAPGAGVRQTASRSRRAWIRNCCSTCWPP
jgi:hypothetical protein